MSEGTIRIGMLGCGTVGAATIRLLHEHADDIAMRAGCRTEVARVAVRDPARTATSRCRVRPSRPTRRRSSTTRTIDVVCEVIGGIEPAKELLLRALANGKSIVTANKELLATDGKELFDAADAAGLDLLFEASVAGGVPLIRPLKESLAGDRIDRVIGIVNGTTNYVLTRMSEQGWSFDEALDEAQRLGFAEADPDRRRRGLRRRRQVRDPRFDRVQLPRRRGRRVSRGHHAGHRARHRGRPPHGLRREAARDRGARGRARSRRGCTRR